MNIVLINHYAGSLQHGMEYRPYYLAREWSRMGHETTIIGSGYSHNRRRNPHFNGLWRDETVDGVRYVWLRGPSYQGNGVMRVLNILSFVTLLTRYAGRIAREYKPDAVIASSTYPLDAYPARIIANKTSARVVYEVHDLWPLSPVELGGMSPGHPFIVLMQRAEDYAYRTADKVVSLLPNAMNHMLEHGMSPEKFCTVPNGIDVGEWTAEKAELPAEHRDTIASLKGAGKFLVGYAGAHGLANALHSLIQAAVLLQDSNAAFLLVGDGPEREPLKKEVATLGLRNVLLLPSVPKKCVPSLLATMDALYIGLQSQPLFRFGVSPNKLFEYMMAGKPVVQAINAGNDIVDERGGGLSVSAEDPAALANAVRALLACTPEQRSEMGKKGKDFVTANHDYGVLARRFISYVREGESSHEGPVAEH
jgi:glycosyltransferase involved in cell wall biosynthesis